MNRGSITSAHAAEPGRVARRRLSAAARVIDAAASLFAKSGYSDTSMAEIARAADVSVGTLYNLFESKEALYRCLVEQKGRKFHARLIAVLEHDEPPPKALDRHVETIFSLFRDEADFLRLYYRISAEARLSVRHALPEETRALYEDTIRALAARLEVTDTPSPYALRISLACQAAASELFLLHLDDPDRHPAAAVLDEAKRIAAAVAKPLLERTTRAAATRVCNKEEP